MRTCKTGARCVSAAPPGSKIDGGTLIETIPAAGTTNVNWVQKEIESFATYKNRLSEFDIIHDHSWFGFSYMERFNPKDENLKICHTHHGHLNWNSTSIPSKIGKINMIGISEFMQKEYEQQGWTAKYVYNGIDTSEYPPGRKNRENRLMFVGRLSTFKRPDEAIKAAIETGTHIDIIGGTFVDDPKYLDTIKKTCEEHKDLISLHLDAPQDVKISLLQKASACLVPSRMSEPFGLVSVESLSCGTPVIAYDDGAIKEIINNKSVGTICKDYAELVAAIKNIPDAHYDTNACVSRAAYFSREKMAERYLKVYKDVVDGKNW